MLLSLISLPRRSINQSQGPGMHCSSAVLLCHTRSTAPHSPTWGKRTDSQQIVPARPPSALFQAAEACDKCAKAPIRLAKCRQGFRSGTKDGQQHKKSPMMHSRCLFHLGRALRASPHVSNPWVHPKEGSIVHTPTQPHPSASPLQAPLLCMMGNGPDWGEHCCAKEGPKRDRVPLCSCSGWKC